MITFGEIKADVFADCDLESEDFFTSTEAINAINEAVRVCEAHIHKLGLEDIYFKARATLALTLGSDVVDFETDANGDPTNIYAHKILRLIYKSTDRVYTITRARLDSAYEDAVSMEVNTAGSTAQYQYQILNNNADDGPQLWLIPAAQETSLTNVIMFYIRKANRMVDDDSVCDIPAFENFIKKYLKWKAHFKEGHPSTSECKADLDEERQLMIETLTNMVPDNDSGIEKDVSAYEEMN